MASDFDTIAHSSSSSRHANPRDRRAQANIGIHIKASRNDFARSHAANWSPSLPITLEHVAIEALKTEWRRRPEATLTYEGYTTKREILIADLYDFEVYRSPSAGNKSRRLELTSLHHLSLLTTKKLCIDGFLCIGSVRLYIQGIPVQELSVEGYGDHDNPSVITYVQSELAKKDASYDIWFRLGDPSQQYKRFQEPFLWVAQLGKHVLDFIDTQPLRSVRLDCFRKDFHAWLVSRFPQNLTFQEWHQAYHGRVDFRTGVHAYIGFLYHQAYNLPNSEHLLANPLWADCMVHGLKAIKAQDENVHYTLATPNVYYCFKDMYFGSKIQRMSPSPPVKAQQDNRKMQLQFPKCQISNALDVISRSNPPCRLYNGAPIKVGDIIAFTPTQEDKKFWGSTNLQWFAYVQRTEPHGDNVQRLFVLYLYCPRETNIFKAQYPFKNELFFSDNCNCTDGELLSTDINGKCEVEWMPTTIPTNTFFIRQTYVTQDSAFVSLEKAHKVCICLKAKPSVIRDYQPGDTVYIAKTVNGHELLEPVVLRHSDEPSGYITVRKLLRLARDCIHLVHPSQRTTGIAINELVLTDDYETVPASRLQRRCHVRFVSRQESLLNQIPFPYNRSGVGDLWFLSMGLTTWNGEQRLMYLARLPDRFHNGPDLACPVAGQKLQGLSIFSGGGSLDRGLQEGGAVEIQHVVDFSAAAMHTQRANTHSPEVKYFCGSVDDYLKAALEGKQHEYIAIIGAVNFIAAGSPCPGFSSLQQNILSESSIRNASHISTFCTYVDLYRPEYGILENVVSMASTRTGFEDQNVFSQLVACLVSMGYQVSQYIMDAWSYGSAQQRSRVFLTIAAPGLEPIFQPWHTHNRPHEDTAGKSLGKLPNGQRLGEREHYPTPFTSLSAGEVTTDLPDIGNGNVQSCIPYPEHRVAYQPTRKDRVLLQCIPNYPPGSGYTEAFCLGLIPPSLLKAGKEKGKSYRRIKEAGLIPTITTRQSIQDCRNGAVVHWSQDRPITILEARRAQGWPDEEPLIGSLTEQYTIVGNGVDRKVALVLGLGLRTAVERNLKRSEYGATSTGLVEELLVEVEKDINGTASGSLNIRLHIPPQPRTAARSVTSATGSVLPLPTNDRTKPNENDAVQAAGMLGLDGTSDPHDSTHGATGSTNLATTSSSHSSSLLARIFGTMANNFGGLAFRSRSAPAVPARSAIHSKRDREEDSTDDLHESTCTRSHDISMRKRARITETSWYSTVKNDTLNGKCSPVNSREVKRKTRYTRHSGLDVTFQPTHWNRRPEQEHGDKE